MNRIVRLLTIFAGLWIAGGTAAHAADRCASEGKVHYLCGPTNVEDMVHVQGTPWIIASGMTGPGQPPGRLYLIDAHDKSWGSLQASVSERALAPYTGCPGPLDLSKFAPHGIAIRHDPDGNRTLYVVNHGGREAIEVFDVHVTMVSVTMRWIGCVVLPAGASGNAVAPLSDGGFVATRFQTAGDPQAFQKMAAQMKNGLLYDWVPGMGFKVVPHSQMSGANGVEASADGKWLFANAWPEKRVIRLRRDGVGAPQSVKVNFLPDNIRMAPDGQLLVAGQDSDMKTLLSCAKAHCPHDWTVIKLDPVSLKITPVLQVKGTDAFSDATVGIQVGHEVWVGTYRGDRVAWATLP